MINIRKCLARLLSSFRSVYPLRFHGVASCSRCKSRKRDNLSNRSIVDAPSFTKSAVRQKSIKISAFHGLDDVASFNGFNSFYDFLRQTFFHNRYIIIDHKDTDIFNDNVYNLSVKNDESYITQIGIAHNCRCNAVEVRKGKYERSNSEEAQRRGEVATTQIGKDGSNRAEMFRFNPGKEKVIFPPTHPYRSPRCSGCGFRTNLSDDMPDTERCEACKEINKLAEKSESAQRKERYLKEMEPLLKKTVRKEAGNEQITVEFTKYGNNHLYSDTFGRAKGLSKDDLKNLDAMLMAADFVKQSAISKPRKDHIVKFYYFKEKEKELYYNVAKRIYKHKGIEHASIFLYSVTNRIQ